LAGVSSAEIGPATTPTTSVSGTRMTRVHVSKARGDLADLRLLRRIGGRPLG
jgi:hypothetical protein